MRSIALTHLRSRVKSNDDWLRTSENLYREEQKRIGAYAREYRESLGLSLREVARRMKISAPFLSDLERGNRHWTDATLTAWENAQRLNKDAYVGWLGHLEKEGRFDLDLQIKLSEKENGLRQDLITLYKLRNSRPCFDEKACRRELRDKLNQKSPSAARVESLLSNPEAVKAMDAFIDQAHPTAAGGTGGAQRKDSNEK